MRTDAADRVKVRLEGVEETLLIPLWARAAETRRRRGLVRDPRAVELVERIDYDFARLALTKGWIQTAVAVRTEIFDAATRAFLAAHPDALVLNLASGLDTRFYRLDNGRLSWVDVDLPRSMALRRQLLTDTERHRYVTGSVLEDAWCEAIERAPGQPVLILIEGLVMYFSLEETRDLLVRLARYFPGAEVLMECVSPAAVAYSTPGFERRGLSARWRGGLEHGRDVEQWDPRLRFVEEWPFLTHRPLRWGVAALAGFFAFMRDAFKIVHLRLEAPVEGGSLKA